ncbi:MAG: ABC transporter ATP-binding protein [Thermodesulfovibrionia bacterium]
MAEIILQNITKNFGSVPVIKDLSLNIKDGEFFTFVGPSGCGKSTLLNMISGLEHISAGRILFNGEEVNHLSPKERDIAMVFQSYALYPHMTVYNNIAFPLKMKKIETQSIDTEVRRVASLLGLEGLLKRKPKELSGGQKQRVALGRAIIRKPRVFLMDEPLSNLDARLRVEMRAELKKLHNELKITVIYVTHDQAEAMSLSDRIAVLYNGMIQQCGTPQDIYLKPDNIMVAGFIGSPSMNFIPASLNKRKPLEIECNGVIFSPLLKNMPENTSIIFGIRPEDVCISSEKSEGCMEVTVSLTESAGSFNWVDVMWKDVTVKGLSKLDKELKPGNTAFMKFAPDKVIVFDANLKKRL